jgi:UDP-glucose 4-epimerase
MNILVTGGAGFIGTNLINRLVKEGHKVFSLDDYSTGNVNNHNKEALYMHSSVTSFDFNHYPNKIDLIFHLAAFSRIQPSFNHPIKTFSDNVVGTVTILEYAKKNNIKVIYAGSCSKWHDPTDSPYASSKFLGEEVCRMYRNAFDVNVEIARFYNVYGPYESLDINNGNVIGIWRKLVELNKPLTIVGDGQQRRDFIHVDDVVDGLYKIALSKQKHEDAWELGTGKNYSIIELYNFFKQRFSSNRINVPDQKGNYRETLLVNNDAEKKLKWKPEDRLKEYILNL